VSNGTKATIRRLKAQLARTQAQIEELQASADTDFLLGIPNRRGFERELNRAIAYIKRYRAGGALVVLDVDRLKPINDAFGHAAGDQVLKAIVTTLLAQVRASDVVGRLGGDEFALLLWNLSETDAHGQGGRAGGSDRSPHLRVRWPHHYRGRLRGRLHSRYPLRSRAARWKRPTAPCMCARRCGGMNVVVKHSSLRATGSRECAPDDRLREAIHLTAQEEWIGFASLAMTRLQPAEIIRHIAELAQQFRVAEFADHGIAAAAEGDGADAAGPFATSSRRALTRSSGSGILPRLPPSAYRSSSCRNGIAT
jgi:GGDEF domain-containing protein